MKPLPEQRTARALAAAFLADGPWTLDELTARGRRALEPEPGWLPALAAARVAGWREPPRDAPGEFARYLRAAREELAAAEPPFVATVTPGRVFPALRSAGYPEPVAGMLTGLCTTRATRDDLATMPGGGTPAARDHLLAALPHLPQGAPTSPQLANLAAHRLHRRLAGLAEGAGAAYTRYADDLTVSGRRGTAGLRDRVAAVVAEEGFAVQRSKTRIRGRGARQTVTGIVVNDRTSLTRAELDALRARLTNAVWRGPSDAGLAAFDGDRHALRQHLVGRVAWVTQVHPVRGEHLAALLAAVDWAQPGE